MRLNHVFQINARFHRSVQIELDRSLEGYVVTQTSLKVIQRIANAIEAPFSTKAWSIIGPYGSGKSALIVFLKSLLGDRANADTKRARDLLGRSDKRLHKKLFGAGTELARRPKGYGLSLVSSGREGIEVAILKGLLHGLEKFFQNSRKPKVLLKIKVALKGCQRGKLPLNDQVVASCLGAHEAVIKAGGAGLFLVVDELGKCLEATALDPGADIFILQKIAETASRIEKHPFLFITVLHQSFDQYAARLDIDKKKEWAKVQGRFEELPFVHTSEQTLRIIHSAIKKPPSASRKIAGVLDATKPVFDMFQKVFKQDPHKTSRQFIAQLKNCLPLHPMTALILPPLFKSRHSQNERSLFAFLSSGEPFGFEEFLISSEFKDKGEFPFYGVEQLYDYFMSNFSVNLFAGARAKKWIEVDNGLSRCSDELERRLVKVIGLLSVLGDASRFPVSSEVLACALSATTKAAKGSVNEVLEKLCKKSIIVYRRYASSYRIWGGSDVDIEQRIREVRQAKINRSDVIGALNNQFPLRPRIAKRHLYKTGTLRYFSVCYASLESLEAELRKPIADGDGEILFVLGSAGGKQISPDRVKALRKEMGGRKLIGYAPNAERLLSLFEELLALQWIKKNTPELQGDEVARREVEARILRLERIVSETTDEIFFPGDAKGTQRTRWFYIGVNARKDKDAFNLAGHDLSAWVSDACDQVYFSSPVIKNELVNRSRLSTAAAMARRTLMHHLFERSAEERLGIEGFPPEMSMYLSLLKNTGIHRKVAGKQWGFAHNASSLERTWQVLWKKLQDYLRENEYRKVPAQEIYDLLRAAPFGLREGVLPIILLALIKANESQIALFEYGSFKSTLRSSDFDLLTKVPQNYAIQLCRISGVKAVVFEGIVDTFVKKGHGNRKYSLLDIVKMLCQFANRLPDYVKKTATLSNKATSVRQRLLESSEPAGLLYRELPLACGFKPFDIKGKGVSNVEAKRFVGELKKSIAEIQRKEAELYGKIEHILLQAFSVNEYSRDQREIVTERANRVLAVTLDPVLKGFLVRVADTHEHRAWLDSIGTVVTGKPPLSWSDSMLLEYEHQMSAFHSKIARYERLALEVGRKSRSEKDEVLQLSIISSKHPESYKIVRLGPRAGCKVEILANKLEELLADLDLEKDSDLVFGALSGCASKLIKEYNAIQHTTKEGVK